MKNNNEHINDNLLIAYLLGELNTEQNMEIKSWLHESSKNQAYFEEIEKLWLETNEIKPKPVSVDIDDAWNKVSEKIENVINQRSKTRNIKFINKQKKILKYSLGVAASFIFLFGLFLIYKNLNKPVEMLTISTEHILTDTISDGTIITLNKKSKLIYPKEFEKNKRQVTLEGEAFFEVMHNPKKPFVIEANGAYIQVLGTSFNVKANPEDEKIIVYVKTGKVRLYTVNETNDTSNIFLTAGEKGFINKKTGEALIDSISKPKEQINEIFWLNKKLIFDDTKLIDVVKVLEKKYKVNIEIIDKELFDKILNTSFENETIEQVLEIISLTFNIKYSKENNVFLIKFE